MILQRKSVHFERKTCIFYSFFLFNTVIRVFTEINFHFNRRYIVILRRKSVFLYLKTNIYKNELFGKNFLILQRKLVNFTIFFSIFFSTYIYRIIVIIYYIYKKYIYKNYIYRNIFFFFIFTEKQHCFTYREIVLVFVMKCYYLIVKH